MLQPWCVFFLYNKSHINAGPISLKLCVAVVNFVEWVPTVTSKIFVIFFIVSSWQLFSIYDSWVVWKVLNLIVKWMKLTRKYMVCLHTFWTTLVQYICVLVSEFVQFMYTKGKTWRNLAIPYIQFTYILTLSCISFRKEKVFSLSFIRLNVLVRNYEAFLGFFSLRLLVLFFAPIV